MIDRLESQFRDAGLEFPFHQLDVKETEYLPEPAQLQGNILFKAKSASDDQFTHAAVCAIATKVFKDFSEAQSHRWEFALFYLTPTSGKLIQSALAGSNSFKEAVDKLGSPVNRLVAIHCFNALIKAGTSFEDARTIDLTQWGNTADLINGKRPCSLLPLLGAYAPARLYSYFPDAVASLVLNKLSEVTYGEVRSKFHEVIKFVFNG